MTETDTSPEAVERLAAIWERSSWAGGGHTHTSAAILIRALAAERDAALARGRADVDAAVLAEREACAAEADCGCPAETKQAVIQDAPNGAARWQACGQAICGAIEAAAIRARSALIDQPAAAPEPAP